MLHGGVLKAAMEHSVLDCPDCGRRKMHRLGRVGFLQRKIYPLFGFYPWECPICRKARLRRYRGKRLKRRKTTG
jgi:ssDNA-binding Zn-finger/Zn-ribbon topoisomerase 1